MSKTVFSHFARPRPQPVHRRPRLVAPFVAALLACMLASGLPVASARTVGGGHTPAADAVGAAQHDDARARSRLVVRGPRSTSSVTILRSYLITEKSFNDWDPATQDRPAPNTSGVFPASTRRVGIYFTYKGAKPKSDTFQLLLYSRGGRQLGGGRIHTFTQAASGEALLVPLNGSYTLRPGGYQAVLLIDGRSKARLTWTVAHARGASSGSHVAASVMARGADARDASRVAAGGLRAAGSVSIPQAYLITEKAFNDWDPNTQDAPAPNTGNVFPTSARRIGIFFKYQGATPNSDTYQFALYNSGGQSIGKGKTHPFGRQEGGEALLVPINDAVALTAGSYQAVLLIDGQPKTRIAWTAGQPASVSVPTSFLITEQSFNDWNPKTQDHPAPNTGSVFPTSATSVGIYFTYKGARANSDTYQLLLDTASGQQIGGSHVHKFDRTANGEALLAPLNSSYTLRPGGYQAVLLVDGARAVALSWTVAGAVAVDITKAYLITARSFDNWDQNSQDAPAPNTSRVFGTTTTKVGIYFTYNGATVGKDTFQFALYSASGSQIGSGRVHTFSSSNSGEALLLPLNVTGPLSPGSYRAVLLIDGQPKTTLTWTVSTGARVPPVTPQHPIVPSRGQVSAQPCNAPNLQRVVTCVEPSVLRVDVHLSNAEAQGTSFVVRVDATGTYLLTNKHVTDGGSAASTQLISPDGKTTYKVLGVLANNAQEGTAGDLAVIHIGPTTLRPLAFGDSDTLAQGQTVASIGYGLAFQLGGPPSVTEGIVSAVGRDLNDGFGPVWIQHQSTINHGNSGGPLLDLKGNVMGVNTLGIDQLPGDKGGNQPVQGVFFAIPSNRAQLIANRLIATMENGH